MESIRFFGMTIKDLIILLKTMPQDCIVTCCGNEDVWLNLNEEDKYLTFDHVCLADEE